MVWRWLSSTVSGASRSIVSQAGIITQVYLPKVIFPIGAAITELIHFGFGLLVIAIFLAFYRIAPGIALLWRQPGGSPDASVVLWVTGDLGRGEDP